MSTVIDPGAGVSTPAAPPAAPGSGVPASPANGSVPASPAGSPVIDWKTAPEQLRTQYETTKAEAERLRAENERWGKLGDFNSVSQSQQAFQQKLTQATQLGATLGFTEQQIRDAMAEDPKGTLTYLLQESQKPSYREQQDIDRRIKEGIDTHTKPIREQFEAQANERANSLYQAERDRLFKSEFSDGLPDENRDELFDILLQSLNADGHAVDRIRQGGQVSDVKRHFEQAKTIFLKRHNSYIAHERGKGQPKPGSRRTDDDQANVKYADRKLSSMFGGGTVKDLLSI